MCRIQAEDKAWEGLHSSFRSLIFQLQVTATLRLRSFVHRMGIMYKSCLTDNDFVRLEYCQECDIRRKRINLIHS